MSERWAKVFLNYALGFTARWLPGALAGVLLMAVTGCGNVSGSTINDIIDAQLRLQNPQLTTKTMRVLLVNQTEATIELDLLVDDALTTVACTPTEARCEFTPPTCPAKIEAVQERRLDPQGAYMGGRNFDENPDFIFTSDDLGCDATIVFTFTEDHTRVNAL
ncbi:MAG TPA: hypothetical protein PKG54_14805 [Phycisphaerae bacterium]|jgi:hypothetical protein|nr:hypothetical protein [Phycisphaerae bacterium]HPU32493.1 hypothetical protein [Phycisphaerae bacterium]